MNIETQCDVIFKYCQHFQIAENCKQILSPMLDFLFLIKRVKLGLKLKVNLHF